MNFSTLLYLFILSITLNFQISESKTNIVDFSYVNTYFPLNVSMIVTGNNPTIPLSNLKNTDIGSCMCDMLFSTCDLNCFCDSDCSSQEKSRFDYKLYEHPPNVITTFCDDQDIININKRGEITIDVFMNLFCVVKDNSPSKGLYLQTPVIFTDKLLDEMEMTYEKTRSMYKSYFTINNNGNHNGLLTGTSVSRTVRGKAPSLSSIPNQRAFSPSFPKVTPKTDSVINSDIDICRNERSDSNSHTIQGNEPFNHGLSSLTSNSDSGSISSNGYYQSGDSILRLVYIPGTKNSLIISNPPYMPHPTSSTSTSGSCSLFSPAYIQPSLSSLPSASFSPRTDEPTPFSTSCIFHSAASTPPGDVCRSNSLLDLSYHFKNMFVHKKASNIDFDYINTILTNGGSINQISDIVAPIIIAKVTKASFDSTTQSYSYSELFALSATTSDYTYNHKPVWTSSPSGTNCGICFNAISDWQTITVLDNGVISKVFVYVILTDIEVSVASSGSTSCSPLSFPQSFSSITLSPADISEFGELTMVTDSKNGDAPYTIAPNGNLIPNQKSGNPGYLPKFPILGGNLVQTVLDPLTNVSVESISRSVAGLTVLTFNSDRVCSLPSIANSLSKTFQVQFGVTTSNTCFLPLSTANLQTMCTTNTFKDYFYLSSSHIGQWGNSSYLNPSDWLSLEIPIPPTPTWNPATQTCHQAPIHLSMSIFTADYGSHVNPQSRIVGTKLSWVLGEVVHDGTSSFALSLGVSTRFIKYGYSELKQVTRRGPPLLPTLPSDFLYPFSIGNSSSSSHSSLHLILLFVLLTSLLSCCIL